MARRALTRIRHYPNRFRHLKYCYLAGASVPGIVEVDNGDTSFDFEFTKPGPNVPASMRPTWVENGSKGETKVPLSPGMSPEQIAAAAAAALEAATLPSVAAGKGLTVGPKPGLNKLTFDGYSEVAYK